MKTAAERKQASRYRAREATLTAEERQWLAAYDGSKGESPIRPRVSPQVQSAAPAPPPRQVQAPAPPPQPVMAPSVAPPQAPPPVEQVTQRVLDFGTDAAPPTIDPAAPGTSLAPKGGACGCLACKRRAGAGVVRCLVTGETVSPALSLDGAKGIASGLMGLLSLGARMFRGVDVKAESHEVTALAKAMVSMSERREQLGFVGQWDDLFAFAFVLISFLARLWNAQPGQA